MSSSQFLIVADQASQLEYLNPEPDRWRVRSFAEMDEAFKYDHYIDLEAIPPEALNAVDRYEYLEVLYHARISEPEQTAGFLLYRILELYQRLSTEFRLWREAAPRSFQRRWIEQRIVNDAGVLGHYVTDGANPHHTTVHFNGWASGYPNPHGFPSDNTFHNRFEIQYVQTCAPQTHM